MRRPFRTLLPAVFSAVFLLLTADPMAGPHRKFIVEEATIEQVQDALRDERLSCRELVDHYLARIDRYDAKGPALNAIIRVNANARAEAGRLDEVLDSGGAVGPLHCIPVVVKDNLETMGMETTAGSRALQGFAPNRDAAAVARLKAAGAIVLAKTNMAEFGLSPVTSASSVTGVTRNPYALDRVPAGSSGGTAVAVAANFAMIGLGTDTGSSIRGPAAHNALVGLRPTMGLVSRTGMVPLNVLSDTVGPMARTAEDAALVLEVLAGWDAHDPATDVIRQWSAPDYEASLVPGMGGRRLGILRQAYQGGALQIDAEVARVFTRALRDMESLGARIVDSVAIEQVPEVPRAGECRGLRYDLNEYLERQASPPVRSLAEIIKTGLFHPSNRQDLIDAETGVQDGPDSEACRANAEYRRRFAEAVTREMDRLSLDALVYPTWSQPPQNVTQVNPYEAGQTLMFATAAGFPAVTVPMGEVVEVLPAGLSFLGRAWSESRLLRLAYAFELTTKHRRPPISAPPLETVAWDGGGASAPRTSR